MVQSVQIWTFSKRFGYIIYNMKGFTYLQNVINVLLIGKQNWCWPQAFQDVAVFGEGLSVLIFCLSLKLTVVFANQILNEVSLSINTHIMTSQHLTLEMQTSLLRTMMQITVLENADTWQSRWQRNLYPINTPPSKVIQTRMKCSHDHIMAMFTHQTDGISKPKWQNLLLCNKYWDPRYTHISRSWHSIP